MRRGRSTSQDESEGHERATYVDDSEIVRREARLDLPENNDYGRASSSSSHVVIPAKASTIPPPPTHRIPP